MNYIIFKILAIIVGSVIVFIIREKRRQKAASKIEETIALKTNENPIIVADSQTQFKEEGNKLVDDLVKSYEFKNNFDDWVEKSNYRIWSSDYKYVIPVVRFKLTKI